MLFLDMLTLLYIYLSKMNGKNFYGNKFEQNIIFSDSPSDYAMTLTFDI